MAIGRDEVPMKLRYGMRHTWRCECADCLKGYALHERKYGNCDCEDCRNTRLWAGHKRDVEVRNNLAPKRDYGPDHTKMAARKVHRHSAKCAFGADCWTTNEIVERESTVATVNFCERHSCETMAKSPAMGMVVIVPETAGPEVIYADAVHTTDRNTVRMELCPGCVGELMEWVDAQPAGERPKAYSKPWKREAKPDVPTSSAELFRLALEASKREMESGEVPE